MSGIGPAILNTIDTVLVTFGVLGTIKRRVESAYDPTAGTSTASVTNYSVKTTPPTYYSEKEVNGTSILTGDCWVDVSTKGLAITPKAGDELVCVGKTFRVVAVEPNYWQSTVVSYRLHLRS